MAIIILRRAPQCNGERCAKKI